HAAHPQGRSRPGGGSVADGAGSGTRRSVTGRGNAGPPAARGLIGFRTGGGGRRVARAEGVTLAAREQFDVGEGRVDEERTSDILRRMAGTGGTGHIAVREMTAVLGDRAFGVIVLALALPNCVFAPPG